MNHRVRPVTFGQVLVSIVIPAFNEEKYLPGTLRAAHKACAVFDQAGWASEIVVCDNNSTDQTASVARASGVQVVFSCISSFILRLTYSSSLQRPRIALASLLN